jgi:cell division septum initiation protein DivIVA
MSDFERSGTTYEEPARRRSAGSWFSDIGDRLARGFNSFDRPGAEEPEWDRYEDVDPVVTRQTPAPEQPTGRRFPTALHGYDRDAVDEHIAGLERELTQLLNQRSPMAAVEAELARVGEETSAVLRVAHEQATEITRRAQVQAEKCVSDAADNAVLITADANRKLRQLDSETDAVWSERIRLIEDVRNVATALFSLAEDACDRFPEESERGTAAIALPPARSRPAAMAGASPSPVAADASPSPSPSTSVAKPHPAAKASPSPRPVPPPTPPAVPAPSTPAAARRSIADDVTSDPS